MGINPSIDNRKKQLKMVSKRKLNRLAYRQGDLKNSGGKLSLAISLQIQDMED